MVLHAPVNGAVPIDYCLKKWDKRLLHEQFIAIITILHAKTEAQPYSLKSLQCQYECLFFTEK